MAKMQVGKRGGVAGTLVVLLFSAVFALAFGAGGFWVGLKPLAQTFFMAWEVRGWQPVQAEVLSAELRSSRGSKGSVTYEAQVRYRYTVGGASYESSRIGLDAAGGSDNVSDWHERWYHQLQSAQAQGRRITVMVDPRQPARALIDPAIRWQMQLFRLPFALVFTAVGLVAAWVFLRVLLGLAKPDAGPDDAPGSSGPALGARGKSAAAVWFFTLFWCGIAFPMAGVLWTTDRTPWFAKAFIGLFVAVGLGLAAYAVRATHMAWRYAGAGLNALPSRPRAGHPVEMTLLLPERAAAYQHDRAPQLRLAQYRVDESSSGSPERRVESFTEPARVQRTADGGLRLVARFTLPADAPPHGAQRSGERVDWRLELLHGSGSGSGADGSVQLAYDVPVQAAPQGFGSSGSDDDTPDRFDRRAAWKQAVPIAPIATAAMGGDGGDDGGSDGGTHGGAGDAPLFVPHSVTLLETPQGWDYRFAQTGWRWAAGLVLAGLAVEAAINERLGAQGLALPHGFFAATAWWGLLAFVLHAATRRWTLSVRDEGLVAHCRSWLWSRRWAVPGDSTQALVHKLLYTTGSGDGEQRYHAVHAPGADGALVRITPGVQGADAATALGQSLASAWAHRRGHFAPGAERPARTTQSRPAWGALLLAGMLAWWLWGPRAPLGEAGGTAPAAVRYSAVDSRLLDAQDAGDPEALRAALAAGGNPNLLASTGSSVLMLAAHRGQMEHVEALLAAGAQPDLRQTRKDSERGDTALLRAFYGGHLAVAQRLVQAGASLSARNRWDWGPMHMAAQSGCIQCLEWLADSGQLIDEPAASSRGETPTMLAAGRGKVEALQWFEAHGVDLARKDPYGKTALDWARFKQQADAEQWLLQRTR